MSHRGSHQITNATDITADNAGRGPGVDGAGLDGQPGAGCRFSGARSRSAGRGVPTGPGRQRAEASRTGRRADRGVSPVIGAVLMVGITVILAAAIGAMVLDMGATAEPAPQASLSASVDAVTDELTLSHRGGDGLPSTRVRLVLSTDDERLVLGPAAPPSVLRVGGTVTVDVAAGNVTSGTWGGMSGTGGFPVESGDRLTAVLVDERAQRVIFEARLDA